MSASESYQLIDPSSATQQVHCPISLCDGQSFHLLEYPSDAPARRERTRLLLTCDTSQDLEFATAFSEQYASHFLCTIVEPFGAAKANRISYVRWLSKQQELARNTVVVVLVGPTTSTCANVDWDVAAALTDSGWGTAGLAGIMLPHYFDMASEVRNLRIIPHRLSSNTSNGYASLYTWEHVMKRLFNAQMMVHSAMESRQMYMIEPDNTLPLRKA